MVAFAAAPRPGKTMRTCGVNLALPPRIGRDYG